jgi:DNA-binding winged helix-turn-helix (wHTH) protein
VLVSAVERKIKEIRKKDDEIIAPLRKAAVTEGKANYKLITQFIKNKALRDKRIDETTMFNDEFRGYADINYHYAASSYLHDVWKAFPDLHTELLKFSELLQDKRIQFKRNSALKAYSELSSKLRLTRDIKIYASFDAISKYKLLSESPIYESSGRFDPDREFEEEFRGEIGKCLDEDPPINEAVFETHDSWGLNLPKDKHKLIHFHDWLTKEFELQPTRHEKIEAGVGRYVVYKDGSIAHDGKVIDLEPKQKIIAAAIIINAPSVTTYDKLIEVYWDDDNLREEKYLDEHQREELLKNIYDCISKLRSIFHVIDGKEHFKNLPKTGYSFLA